MKNHENSELELFRKKVIASTSQVEQLKKQLAQETKDRYSLYSRIKELRERLNALENKSPEMSTNSGSEYIQKYKT